MTYIGHIQNGVVILDDPADLPEGAAVRVEPLPIAEDVVPGAHARLLDLAGTLKGLPPDFAANHDHYIHGAPKR